MLVSVIHWSVVLFLEQLIDISHFYARKYQIDALFLHFYMLYFTKILHYKRNFVKAKKPKAKTPPHFVVQLHRCKRAELLTYSKWFGMRFLL